MNTAIIPAVFTNRPPSDTEKTYEGQTNFAREVAVTGSHAIPLPKRPGATPIGAARPVRLRAADGPAGPHTGENS